MEIEDKWNTKEYKNYNKAIVKLLSDSLKEGEYFIFSKSGECGIIVSEERTKDINLSYETKAEKILKVLKEDEVKDGWFTGKADNLKIKV